MSKIFLSPPHLSETALKYLQDAVASNWIAPVGPYVEAFEEALRKCMHVDYALAVNSGTSAIHLGLLALGVGSNDEVICSTFTFCASANPIIYCGAKPVFVDSEEETWNMDPAILEEAIEDRLKKTGRRPKAIIVVHLYGMPAKMNEILTIAARYEIPVLEDAAEALGALYRGSAVGTLGDIGILSFNGNKIITASSGGALISNSARLTEKARYFRQEAKEPLPYYEHKSVGYNYRLSNLLAALGTSQLEILEDRVRRKRQIFDYYYSALSASPGVSFQNEPADVKSNRWLTTILMPNRDCEKIRSLLAKQDIESRRLWKPMHLQPVFKNLPYYGSGVSERLFNCGLCLPSGTALEREELDRVVNLLMDSFRNEQTA